MKTEGDVGSIETFAILFFVLMLLTMIVNLVTMLYAKKSLNQLWSFLGAFQLFVHMPLYNTYFPANATYFCTILQRLATFDFLPTSTWRGVFDLPVKQSLT